jgi:hypothetical protein
MIVVAAASKTQCALGYYSTGQAINCKPCDYGYICQPGSTSANPASGACPQGYWCDGKLQYDCPAGTYNPHNASTSQADCLICPAGTFTFIFCL